jgi:hypothetical protein
MLLGSCKNDEETVSVVPLAPTLSSIQSTIFNTACASTLCHGTSAGSLSLAPGDSYGQLVNIRSTRDADHSPQFFRVLPGKPDSSFLLIKVTHPSGTQGDLMPTGLPALTAEQITAIRTWITNGALNN